MRLICVLLIGIVAPLSGCAVGPSGVRDLPVRELNVEFFFCGCAPCATVVSRLGDRLLSSGRVFFAGSPADADEFQRSFELTRRVNADLTGDIAESRGVRHCPAAVVTRSGEIRIFGNGASHVQAWLDQLVALLEQGK